MRFMSLFLVFLLLLVPAASAQEVEWALAAAVSVLALRNNSPVRGSGFVVALEPSVATVVTAAHVIEGARFEVMFATSATERFPVQNVDILAMESGDSKGLAVFQVRGALPDGITVLTFDVEPRLQAAESLLLVGFSHRIRKPLAKRRTYSGRQGNELVLDLPVGEGFSGAPVLRGGRVVGVVTREDVQLTYAVTALMAREFTLGSGVALEALGEVE